MSAGSFVLVGTPIGNLGDLAPRAVEVLADADVIACEDTRRTGRLLAHAGVEAPRLLVVNDHTERARVDEVVGLVASGHRVALVTDAGMPVLSDPGSALVSALVDAGHAVEVVPGASAAVTALVLSGLPTDRWCFEGFLPRKGSGRSRRLAALASESRTMVLYEAPHRLGRTIDDLVEVLGPDRPVAIARELTKLHEEVWRGCLGDAVSWAGSRPRGEFVLVVRGAPDAQPPGEDEIVAAIDAERAAGASTKDAATRVAQRLGVSRRTVYGLATR